MARPGRPEYVAVLPAEDVEGQLVLMESFYEIIDNLTYREQLGLGRALYINPNGIRTHYKTRKCFPGFEVAKRVIEWDRNGRPLTTRKREDDWFNF